MNRHKFAKELRTNHLKDHNNRPYRNESRIGPNTFEHMDLIVDFSCADHIQDLHENKHIEHDC